MPRPSETSALPAAADLAVSHMMDHRYLLATATAPIFPKLPSLFVVSDEANGSEMSFHGSILTWQEQNVGCRVSLAASRNVAPKVCSKPQRSAPECRRVLTRKRKSMHRAKLVGARVWLSRL